jgi:hypothetical protein
LDNASESTRDERGGGDFRDKKFDKPRPRFDVDDKKKKKKHKKAY